MDELTNILHTFIGLLAVVNPLAAVPLFVSLTAASHSAEKRVTARFAALTVATVLGVAAIAGQPILQLFGISLAAFRVAGGILILLVAISMLNAKVSRTQHTSEEGNEAAGKDQAGVVPLGIPLLAGPGAISTTIIYAHQNNGDGLQGMAILLAEIVLVALLVWLVLLLAEYLARWLGTTGLNIATRIMGLLLAAIAVGFITEGLVTLLPGLA